MAKAPGRRTAVIGACVIAAAIVLPLASRAVSRSWHDDSLWANSLRSLGGLEVPFDFAIFLQAAEDIRAGDSPYVDPDELGAGAEAPPYAYPPVLAIVLIPATALPDTVAGSSLVGVLVSLLLVGCVVGTLFVLDVRDWRCYPVALLYPPTLENIEYGAVGPALALLVALAWRNRARVWPASAAVGAAVVLKVFLWPLLVWLAATRRWKATAGALGVAFGLALVSWAAIGFRGLIEYPELLRRLSDLEAENSYSAYAIAVTAGLPGAGAQVVVAALAGGLVVAGWRAAGSEGDLGESDRRALTLMLAAGFVLTPILWLHYLVLLVVPIALARPRLSGLWLVPLGLTVFEALDWYRGWPSGDWRALASVAIVTAIVFGVSSLPSRTAERRLAAWL